LAVHVYTLLTTPIVYIFITHIFGFDLFIRLAAVPALIYWHIPLLVNLNLSLPIEIPIKFILVKGSALQYLDVHNIPVYGFRHISTVAVLVKYVFRISYVEYDQKLTAKPVLQMMVHNLLVHD
jgi:energy-converting hydrogenase Eha subunit C